MLLISLASTLNRNQSATLNSRLIDRLFALEGELRVMARRFNLELNPTPDHLRERLQHFHFASLLRIESNLQALHRVWLKCEIESVDPWNDVEFLTLSMRSLGLSFPQDFTTKMRTEDLVEGYDQDRYQVFRNMRFMETSSYSLMEIQSYEWPELFHREHKITESLLKYSDTVLWENNCTVALNIPEHSICEIKTKSSQVCTVQFRHMAPLFFGPNRRFGVLVSCRAKEQKSPAIPIPLNRNGPYSID